MTTEVDRELLQKLLDSLGNTPGGLLVRGPDRWIVLQPGNIGDVLVVGPGAMLEWKDPSTVPFGT